jgi:FkbH-like protein
MRVSEALKILHGSPKDAKPFSAALACGFTPLHLQTFLSAYLQRAFPDRRVTVTTGLYGNLTNTVEGFVDENVQNLAVALEWADLDSRLGYRASARWDSRTMPDIVASVAAVLERLRTAIEQLAAGAKVAVSMPTLSMPPLFYTPGWAVGESESLLYQMVAEFRTKLARSGIPVVNQTRLAEQSAPERRYDFKSDLLLGLPYTLTHADALASILADLLCPPASKKGIITDLDDTLWSGLIGEAGADGIHWDLANHSGLHALYQSLLASLSECGALVGVASRNDPAVARMAFERSDMLLREDRVFPMEVHWGAKSESVRRILRAWNVSADDVVFVDDSPMELAEVATAHPGIECIQFPGKDYAAGYAMLRRIRDLFGKHKLSSEDSIRLDSIRQSAQYHEAEAQSSPERFLQEANANVHFDTDKSTRNSRALELVNKTNQFNLNGIRYTESDWASELSRPNAHSMVVSYEDRFGILGKIAVILGRLNGDTFHIMVWVMSCRAFARRIEYLCLRRCFERYQIHQIEFDFVATSKNAPLQEFLTDILGRKPVAPVVLTRERFEQVCPSLYQTVTDPRRPEVDERNAEPANKVL